MCHIRYKLIVNVNVSKMAFAQKIQVRLNREGGIYGNSRRHSQL